MITKDLLTEASIELSRIDRYFRGQYGISNRCEDFPTDNLWELIQQVSKGLQEVGADDYPM